MRVPWRCRAAAVEKDDLSLLGGLTAKEIAGLNRRGIFTVTQYSYTFRPGRLKRVTEKAAGTTTPSRRWPSARRRSTSPSGRELPDAKPCSTWTSRGCPDRDFYYLIGLPS